MAFYEKFLPPVAASLLRRLRRQKLIINRMGLVLFNPDASTTHMREAQLDRIRTIIGQPDTAKILFKPRVDAETVEAFTSAILSRLKIHPVNFGAVCDFAKLHPTQIGPWATQLWANTISELANTDEELGKAFREGGGLVPTDPATVKLYKRKLAERFHFFVWIFGWGAAVGDTTNCFTARLIVLDGVIRIEDIQSKRNGLAGGWGLLDAVVDGVRLIAGATGQRVKTVATSDKIELAFRRRGFVDQVDEDRMEHSTNARPLELATV
jgi:hypothetical protein